jgi:hypothetical protein
MRKLSVSVNTLFLTSTLFIASCGGSKEQKATEKKPKKDTLTVKKEKEAPEEKPIVSLTKKEALARMKAFLKENSKKYSDYGEVDDMTAVGGNYTADGATDYFYNVQFYEGGDFVYTTHFFFDSEQDKIRELEINKAPTMMKSIIAKELKDGKIIGSANLWSAAGMDLFADRSVNAEFTIDGNKINFDKKYMPKFKKAEKEIAAELEKLEREMMENADGINSSEEVDY